MQTCYNEDIITKLNIFEHVSGASNKSLLHIYPYNKFRSIITFVHGATFLSFHVKSWSFNIWSASPHRMPELMPSCKLINFDTFSDYHSSNL